MPWLLCWWNMGCGDPFLHLKWLCPGISVEVLLQEYRVKNRQWKLKKIKHIRDNREKEKPEVLYVTMWGGSVAEALSSLAEGRGAVCNHPDPMGCALPVLETPSCLTSCKPRYSTRLWLLECAGKCDSARENRRAGRSRVQWRLLIEWCCTVREGGCFPAGPSAAGSPGLPYDTWWLWQCGRRGGDGNPRNGAEGGEGGLHSPAPRLWLYWEQHRCPAAKHRRLLLSTTSARSWQIQPPQARWKHERSPPVSTPAPQLKLRCTYTYF